MTNLFNPVVVTSGAFDFSPSGGEFILNAFDRIQVRPTEIEQTQMQRAIMELNLTLVRFNTLPGQNLWTISLNSIPLVQGSATYSIPAQTRMILSAYIRYSTNPTLDRYVYPISRDEYAAITTKGTQAFPSQYWFDRLISPTVTFYPVPDGGYSYDFFYYAAMQVQDAQVANGQNVQIPYRFFDAITADLAHRLARIYRPELEQQRKADRDEAWGLAATDDTEWTPLYITPGLTGYYRR
jgi:hypothetical protein